MPDWMYITSLAYDELCRAKVSSLPIDPRNIKFPDIVVLSYQKYAALSGQTVEQVACRLEDAYATRGLRPGLNLVLYNAAAISAREQHSLWHEIGHIRLRHQKHGGEEELEANFFAQQANAPGVIIREMEYRGYTISEEFLMDSFGVSRMSAQKKMDYLTRFPGAHHNPHDKALLKNLTPFLNKKYPPHTHTPAPFAKPRPVPAHNFPLPKNTKGKGGNLQMGKKQKDDRKNSKDLSHLDLESANAASSTDFTGLIPANPQSVAELESYDDVYDMGPDDKAKKK